MKRQWGLDQETVKGLVGWKQESGWEGLEKWATSMEMDAEEELDQSDDDMEAASSGTGQGDTVGKKGKDKKKKKKVDGAKGSITEGANKKPGPSTTEMLAALTEGLQAGAKDGSGAANHTE